MSNALPSLSEREKLILQASSEGDTAGKIGRKIGLSQNTVEKKRGEIYRKLGVNTCSAAVAIAQRAGIIKGWLKRPTAIPHLKPAEKDVAPLVAEGLTDKQIAERLGYEHEHNAKDVVQQLMGKLGCPNRVALASALLALNIVTWPWLAALIFFGFVITPSGVFRSEHPRRLGFSAPPTPCTPHGERYQV